MHFTPHHVPRCRSDSTGYSQQKGVFNAPSALIGVPNLEQTVNWDSDRQRKTGYPLSQSADDLISELDAASSQIRVLPGSLEVVTDKKEMNALYAKSMAIGIMCPVAPEVREQQVDYQRTATIGILSPYI